MSTEKFYAFAASMEFGGDYVLGFESDKPNDLVLIGEGLIPEGVEILYFEDKDLALKYQKILHEVLNGVIAVHLIVGDKDILEGLH